MTDKKKITTVLKRYFGFDTFKGNQEEIILNLLNENDTFVLMPTGGGKSLCYQLPSLLMEGTAIVISPLIALMKNQVDAMRMHSEDDGIAHFLNSSLNKMEINRVKEDILAGKTKLLYVAPESLTKEENIEFLKGVKISFYAIDEAHCISEWGHDFRPEYRRIRPIINEICRRPVIALTATATPKVQHDIMKNLDIQNARVFKSSFNRPNLYYEVRPKMADVDKEIIRYIKSMEGKSGIIYCLSRKEVEDLAKTLQVNNIKAKPYHAGMDSATRSATQDAFLKDEIDVIVATIAFGMGIDKPDVRVVIHYDCPDSIEAYFQEAGRAGRDGLKAYAVLLYDQSDRRKLDKRIIDNFPDKDYIRDVYEHLAYYYQIGVGSGGGHTFSFEIDKFCHTYHYFPIQVDASLKILQRAGYLVYETDPDASARLMFLLGRNELYRLEQTLPEEEAAITALLRNYGGLFTDYVYIDESLIAQQSGLTPHQLYYVLKSLSQRRIVHFIPQRKTPYITYLQDREDVERVVLAPSVYEERREQFAMRIHALLAYAENHEVCRSRQLLDYFGETRSDDCRCCDVCIAQSKQSYSEGELQMPISRIRALLDDGGRHPITDLLALNLPKRLLDAALRTMVDEEIVLMEDGEIFLSE